MVAQHTDRKAEHNGTRKRHALHVQYEHCWDGFEVTWLLLVNRLRLKCPYPVSVR